MKRLLHAVRKLHIRDADALISFLVITPSRRPIPLTLTPKQMSTYVPDLLRTLGTLDGGETGRYRTLLWSQPGILSTDVDPFP